MTFFQGELGSGIPAQLQYKAEGEISGPLEEPSAIRLNFNLEHFSGKLKHIPFALIQPIRIHCHMGYCPLPMTLIQLHDLKNPLKIEGLLHSFYSFLHFHFSGDLDNLFYQIWGIPLYQAKLHSDIYWHYRPGHAHRFSGRFNLTHGRFQHLSDPTPFSDITLHASIHNQTLLIEHISGLHQKGYFKGEGECIFNGFHEPRLQLLIQTQQLKLQWGRDFIATISGNGSLSGPIYHLLAEGRFHVDHLIYSAPISLESFINRKDIKSSTGSFLPRFPLQLQLNLRFFAERHIFVQNHLLDAELGADLTFKGSLTHIGVLGSISKVNAVARYRDIAFKITRANISFTEEFRIFSVFFIEAEAQACNIHMRMNFHGNSDDYVVQPTGQDDQGPVSSQDIWSCLQFGLRLRDFDGNQSHHAGLSDALPGTLDTLWMVSGLQSQMNQILPTQLFDELRLTSAWSSKGMKSTPRIIIGKRLKTGVLLRYARSIDEYDEQALSLEYRLNRRTIFQSSYATQIYVPVGDFGLDLRLRWERD
jgi:hypothetical protein